MKYQITVSKEQLVLIAKVIDESPDEDHEVADLAFVLNEVKIQTDEGKEGPFDLTEAV